MKCARCTAEIPAQAQFCMRCGNQVLAAKSASGGAVTMARPVVTSSRAAGPKKGLIAALAVAVLVLGAAAMLGLRYLNLTGKTGTGPGGTQVVNATGLSPGGTGLLDRNGRIGPGSNLPNAGGIAAQPPPNPADVIDYLKFLKDIERRRVTLEKRQTGELLGQSQMVVGNNIMAQMKDSEADISGAINKNYGGFQQKLAEWPKEWNALSTLFLSKAAPQSCSVLQGKYYDMLGKCGAGVVAVGNAFSKAMGGLAQGDPTKALEAVETLKGQDGSGTGSPSKGVADATASADEELATVCNRFNIRKDFDIRDSGGGGLLSGLGGMH